MCSGSIEPVYVLKALIDGMDGVLIGGCHLGDCHYHNGNYKAMRRIEILKTIVRQTGLDENRVWLRWISASEGGLFRETVDQFVAELKAKGPSLTRQPWSIWQETFGQWKPRAFDLPEH